MKIELAVENLHQPRKFPKIVTNLTLDYGGQQLKTKELQLYRLMLLSISKNNKTTLQPTGNVQISPLYRYHQMVDNSSRMSMEF